MDNFSKDSLGYHSLNSTQQSSVANLMTPDNPLRSALKPVKMKPPLSSATLKTRHQTPSGMPHNNSTANTTLNNFRI